MLQNVAKTIGFFLAVGDRQPKCMYRKKSKLTSFGRLLLTKRLIIIVTRIVTDCHIFFYQLVCGDCQ